MVLALATPGFGHQTTLIYLQEMYLALLGIITLAYLDPGTGSYIIQILVAALASMAFVLKMYWYKFKSLFTGERRSVDEATSDE